LTVQLNSEAFRLNGEINRSMTLAKTKYRQVVMKELLRRKRISGQKWFVV